MQSRQGDELEVEPNFTQIPNERLELLLAKAMGAPVERRREVVDEPSVRSTPDESVSGRARKKREGNDSLVRVLGVDVSGETLRLLEVGLLGLEPNEVGVGRVGEGALHSGLRDRIAEVSSLRG